VTEKTRVKPIIKAAPEDESKYVPRQVEDAKDDIKFYLRRRFKHRKKQSESNGLSSKSIDTGGEQRRPQN
jgi:hypothetical protein